MLLTWIFRVLWPFLSQRLHRLVKLIKKWFGLDPSLVQSNFIKSRAVLSGELPLDFAGKTVAQLWDNGVLGSWGECHQGCELVIAFGSCVSLAYTDAYVLGSRNIPGILMVLSDARWGRPFIDGNFAWAAFVRFWNFCNICISSGVGVGGTMFSNSSTFLPSGSIGEFTEGRGSGTGDPAAGCARRCRFFAGPSATWDGAGCSNSVG